MGAKAKSRRRVLLVDDHPIVSESLAELLNQSPDLQVCGACHSARQVLSALKQLTPDLMVIDIGLDGVSGIDIIKQVKQFHPKLSILVLSIHDERVYAERALRAGALGYVMKQAPVGEILRAIRRTLDGQRYLSRRMENALAQRVGAASTRWPEFAALTDREIEVFALLGNGASAGEIARRLSITVKTVQSFRASIKEKLRLRNSSAVLRAAVDFARKHGH